MYKYVLNQNKTLGTYVQATNGSCALYIHTHTHTHTYIYIYIYIYIVIKQLFGFLSHYLVLYTERHFAWKLQSGHCLSTFTM